MNQVENWPQSKRKNKKRTITNPNQSTGHWSEQEHTTYVEFLNMHRSVIQSQDQKKTNKIFKQMSETIGTRSPSQCRSHHQKFNPFTHKQKGKKKPNPISNENYFQQLMYYSYPPQTFVPFMFPNENMEEKNMFFMPPQFNFALYPPE